MSLKRLFILLSFFTLACFLAACSSGSSTSPSGSGTGGNIQTPVTGKGSPGSGPIVISTVTPVVGGNGHSQQIQLKDRTLIITDVTKQTGVDASSVGVSVSLTIKNTGDKAILNQGNYFQLISSEGDSFGVQSKVTSGFYGSIEAHGARTGTIVFQVPSGAAVKLRMFYRSEIATETVFVPLNI